MKTVGQLLKSAREKNSYTLKEVEQATKIRLKYLESLETDDYDKLPSGTYAKGFIKNYARFLNLNINSLLAVFRRDFTENEQGKIIPRSMVNPLNASSMFWTPKATIVAIVVTLITAFGGFIVYQYQGLFQPKLEVTIPSEGEILLGPDITVAGIADPSAVVSMNDQLVVVDPDGSFSATLNLSTGRATVKVEATSSRGNTTTVVRNVEVRVEE